jgi:hypothetical protein
MSHCGLLLGTPRNKIRPKENSKTANGLMIIRVASPVYIRESTENRRCRSSKSKANTQHVLNIAKNALDSGPMNSSMCLQDEYVTNIVKPQQCFDILLYHPDQGDLLYEQKVFLK